MNEKYEQFRYIPRIPDVVNKTTDQVNHPAHYTDGGIETIEFIETKKLNYHRGNAVKYISRAGEKSTSEEVQDIEKAIWYLQREVKKLKG